LIIVALGVLGLFIFALLAAWASRNLPDPNILTTHPFAQSTKIYDRTGTHLLYEIHGDEKRTLIKIEELPANAKQATISIEDKKFYEHHGIYWKGVVRATLINLFRGRAKQGASTLTQQLVKNAFLTRERTFTRKLKEFVLAFQLERTYTKDQILQLYFNEIPYGSNLYGIESAAQAFFGKSAKDLTLDESALLAAIPQAPDFYSPYGIGLSGDNRSRLIARQRSILDLMVEQNYIKEDEATSAKQIETLKKLKPKNLGDIQAPHFVMYVRSQLIERYGEKQLEEGGLRVITTLDWDKQQAAKEAVEAGVEARGKKYGFNNAALVSLDPKTGQILAMVGSKDFFDTEHDGQVNVTLRPRQPGSSFKPIVYAAGFIRGYLPQTQLWDVTTLFKTDFKDYTPHNYDLKERGPVSIRQALQGSLNIPAVKMLYLVGVGHVLDFAENLGYTTFADRSRFGLALVLGGGEVKPIEHVAAFATFANEGTLYPTSAILKVEDSARQTLEEWKLSPGAIVMDPQVTRLISHVLSDNNARASVFGLSNYLTLPDRPVAAKTGTTNDYHDAWTLGYTPGLATAVWVGNNDNAAMNRGADGSVIAAPIWQAYMKAATKKMPIEMFTSPTTPTTNKPSLLGQVAEQKISVNALNGKIVTSSTPPEWVETHMYREAHSILYYVDKDDPTGPAPANPYTDPQFANWENAIQAWIQKTNWMASSTLPAIPTEFDDTIIMPIITSTSTTTSTNP
ncbi:hypothetical protein EXS71_04515, partial [Candidatus Uhrbacteria bacterium]|nr:hypothetical protein [Candidatus Uhrbacteria bacterium]